jgi:hypothetical protein
LGAFWLASLFIYFCNIYFLIYNTIFFPYLFLKIKLINKYITKMFNLSGIKNMVQGKWSNISSSFKGLKGDKGDRGENGRKGLDSPLYNKPVDIRTILIESNSFTSRTERVIPFEPVNSSVFAEPPIVSLSGVNCLTCRTDNLTTEECTILTQAHTPAFQNFFQLVDNNVTLPPCCFQNDLGIAVLYYDNNLQHGMIRLSSQNNNYDQWTAATAFDTNVLHNCGKYACGANTDSKLVIASYDSGDQKLYISICSKTTGISSGMSNNISVANGCQIESPILMEKFSDGSLGLVYYDANNLDDAVPTIYFMKSTTESPQTFGNRCAVYVIGDASKKLQGLSMKIFDDIVYLSFIDTDSWNLICSVSVADENDIITQFDSSQVYFIVPETRCVTTSLNQTGLMEDENQKISIVYISGNQILCTHSDDMTASGWGRPVLIDTDPSVLTMEAEPQGCLNLFTSTIRNGELPYVVYWHFTECVLKSCTALSYDAYKWDTTPRTISDNDGGLTNVGHLSGSIGSATTPFVLFLNLNDDSLKFTFGYPVTYGVDMNAISLV